MTQGADERSGPRPPDPEQEARRDEVELSWGFCDPILKAWEQAADAPEIYERGSQGPTQADELLHRDGRTWVDIS